jgi:hypothetical protein
MSLERWWRRLLPGHEGICPRCGKAMIDCVKRDGSATWRCVPCNYWKPRTDAALSEGDAGRVTSLGSGAGASGQNPGLHGSPSESDADTAGES